MSNIITEFFEHVSHINGPVLTDISGGMRRSIQGSDLIDRLDRLASVLYAAGAMPGDRVVAIFDNTLESALTLLMAMRHGITLCLQPVGTPRNDIDRLKAGLEAKTIINTTRQVFDDLLTFRLDNLDALEPTPGKFLATRVPFTVTFTSGSTGTPKGVVHCAESYLTCAKAFNRQTNITSKDRFLNAMPMFYMAGIFNGILAPLAAGASVVITDAFSTATAMQFWPTIANERITALWLSPTMLSLVMRLDRTDKTLPSCMRKLFVGTGAIAASDAAQFFHTYGLPPLQSYGLSELLYVSVESSDSPEFGAAGRTLYGVTAICDDDSRLSIESPYAFLGYLIDGSLDPHDGAFITSDLARMTELGNLALLGRIDDIIVRGGVNVNPVELEAILAPTMCKRSFCIVGLKDKILGQKLVLVTQGSRLSDEDFSEAQKVVRNYPGRVQLDATVQVANLPVGPTGKIRRAALKLMLENECL